MHNLVPLDHRIICQLGLRVLGNLSINHDGKQECIDNKVIKACSVFLDEGDGDNIEDALNASLIIMSCSIHLEGKKQIVNEVGPDGEPVIIKLIINRLQDQQDQDIQEYADLRKNLKVALINVAELPDGFLKICRELADKVAILDEIFGPRSVKALH